MLGLFVAARDGVRVVDDAMQVLGAELGQAQGRLLVPGSKEVATAGAAGARGLVLAIMVS